MIRVRTGLRGGLESEQSAIADVDRQSERGWSRAIGLDVRPGRFFEGPNVSWRIAPFALAGLLPFALLPFAGVSVFDVRVCDRGRASFRLIVALAR